VLGDPATRGKYDELGANWRQYEQAARTGGANPFAGWNVNTGGGHGGGFRTMTPEEMENIFGDQNPFSDFFTTFFGAAGPSGGTRNGRSGRARTRGGRDVEHELDLTLDEAYHGTTKRLALSHGGPPRTVDVRIPAGVGEGSRVRVASEGEPGTGGGPAGDLYLRLKLAPHATFERRGQDLHTTVAVPVPTAVLGGEVEVPTMAGKTVRLKIPPFTQNGQVFRLKTYGMPARGSHAQGDLYAKVEAQVPTSLTAEEREHYSALAKLHRSGDTANSAA
jgi:curved DNA-binding protein